MSTHPLYGSLRLSKDDLDIIPPPLDSEHLSSLSSSGFCKTSEGDLHQGLKPNPCKLSGEIRGQVNIDFDSSLQSSISFIPASQNKFLTHVIRVPSKQWGKQNMNRSPRTRLKPHSFTQLHSAFSDHVALLHGWLPKKKTPREKGAM